MIRVIGSRKVTKGLSNVFCSKDSISPETCINVKSTGVSSYDDFLDPSKEKYLREHKNLVGHIEYMTPLEYYQACAKIFKSSVDRLKASREADDKSIDFLTENLEKGRKFFLPYVNFAEANQEGLHRMMVIANHFGWEDNTYPVLVVEYADPHRHDVDAAKKSLQSAIDGALDYKYLEDNLPDELISEVQWKLDTFAEEDESTPYTAKCLNESDSEYVFTLVGFENDIALSIKKSDVQLRNADDFSIDDEDLDIDLDDLAAKGVDINDIDAVLKYLS